MDSYQTITDRIVAAIERGAGEWRMPWHAADGETIATPHNFTGRAYRGVNVPILWAEAEAHGYSSPIWATYKQWQEAGAQVRKGEKAATIVFWKQVSSKSEDDEEQTHLMCRAYFVFNAAQVDGYQPKPVVKRPVAERIAAAEEFFSKTGSIVHHGGNRAYYTAKGDFIAMPELCQFDEAESYYATLGHEHIHWTGHEKRLSREFGQRFGDQAYAFEELVAELGAAFLCGKLGLSNEPRQDHAAYLANWLKVLKNDKRAIFTAASKAQAAVDYLEG